MAPLPKSEGPSSSAPCRVKISVTAVMTLSWVHSTLLSGRTTEPVEHPLGVTSREEAVDQFDLEVEHVGQRSDGLHATEAGTGQDVAHRDRVEPASDGDCLGSTFGGERTVGWSAVPLFAAYCDGGADQIEGHRGFAR